MSFCCYKSCRAIFFFLSSLAFMLLYNAHLQAGELDRFQGLKGTVKIAGGTAHIPIMIEATKRIQSFNPDIQINVTGGGSSLGIRKVAEGIVDIGNSGRALNDEEREKYRLISYPFALDGIAVVVHPGNPVSEFSREQTKKVFSGKVGNWRELGGADALIVLYGRDNDSATREVFWKKLLAKGVTSPDINIVSSNSTMRNIVSMDRDAVGYISIGHIDPAKVKAIRVDGIKPSQRNALAGKYTISRKLHMHTTKNPSQLTALFVEYIQSDEGKGIIKESGYIPLR